MLWPNESQVSFQCDVISILSTGLCVEVKGGVAWGRWQGRCVSEHKGACPLREGSEECTVCTTQGAYLRGAVASIHDHLWLQANLFAIGFVLLGKTSKLNLGEGYYWIQIIFLDKGLAPDIYIRLLKQLCESCTLWGVCVYKEKRLWGEHLLVYIGVNLRFLVEVSLFWDYSWRRTGVLSTLLHLLIDILGKWSSNTTET